MHSEYYFPNPADDRASHLTDGCNYARRTETNYRACIPIIAKHFADSRLSMQLVCVQNATDYRKHNV